MSSEPAHERSSGDDAVALSHALAALDQQLAATLEALRAMGRTLASEDGAGRPEGSPAAPAPTGPARSAAAVPPEPLPPISDASATSAAPHRPAPHAPVVRSAVVPPVVPGPPAAGPGDQGVRADVPEPPAVLPVDEVLGRLDQVAPPRSGRPRASSRAGGDGSPGPVVATSTDPASGVPATPNVPEITPPALIRPVAEVLPRPE